MDPERPFITDQETPTMRVPVQTHRRHRKEFSPLRAITYVIVSFVVAFFALCVAVLVAEGTGQNEGPAKPKRMELPRYVSECENEDGSGSRLPCYWDAGKNGKGATYIINIDGSTTQLVPDPH